MLRGAVWSCRSSFTRRGIDPYCPSVLSALGSELSPVFGFTVCTRSVRRSFLSDRWTRPWRSSRRSWLLRLATVDEEKFPV